MEIWPPGLVHWCCKKIISLFFIFGGHQLNSRMSKQVLKIDDCEIKEIGLLSFELVNGGCAVANEEIFLCFSLTSAWDTKVWHRCRKSKEPVTGYETLPLSSYPHRYTKFATSEGKH